MRGYVVKAGDTLSNIASALLGSASRWRELQSLNALPSDLIRVGQTLLIPDASADGLAPITPTVAPLPTSSIDELLPVTPTVAPILAPVTPTVVRLPVPSAPPSYTGIDPQAGEQLTQEITVSGKRIDYTILALIGAGALLLMLPPTPTRSTRR